MRRLFLTVAIAAIPLPTFGQVAGPAPEQREVSKAQEQPEDERRRLHEIRQQADEDLAELRAKREAAVATDRLQEDLQKAMAEIDRLHQQLAEQKSAELPPIENGQIKVFNLVNSKAAETATTIESLFGAQALRLAVDERANSIIALGKSDTLEPVEALIMQIDQQAAPSDGAESKPKAAQTSSARSVLLRVFWLADGVPNDEGEDPKDFLPSSVLRATAQLGLRDPRLVSQTVNSLATYDAEGEVRFNTSVPAIIAKLPAVLNCTGAMRPIVNERVGLDMQINVSGQMINCQLAGSLATPLGHYMVLGTANSVIGELGAGGQYGVGMGGMPGMGEAGGGYGRGGFGGEGAYAAAMAPPQAADNDAAEEPSEDRAKPALDTSRFAFVVQVIEGESYEPAEIPTKE